ncbi:hypothetical protein FA13DRAFT_1726756 [Coprinellus micaceus]|uniref:Uncharacterized protein n=1 Tax=Coprinellus micaceus TaxID=71717 RepID=A0A4Y7TTY5_COPMI|nr:hypothetical protein FA13DRAFT_1726756 [Coprinellus micaceus]
MLPAILELLYEYTERSVQHTIVVVGAPSAQALASVASNITILKFADVEREGVRLGWADDGCSSKTPVLNMEHAPEIPVW